MIAWAGLEARYLGQRVQVLSVRGAGRGHLVEIVYLSGSSIGATDNVSEDELEPLGATARPTFGVSQQVPA